MKMGWFLVLLALLVSVAAYTPNACPGSSLIKLSARSDDAYWLSFVNRDGLSYQVPFVESSTGSLRYGKDESRTFITEEVSDFDALVTSPAPEDAFNIELKDMFLVTGGGEVGSSHVLEYEGADVSNHVLSFQDLASGPQSTGFSPAQDKDPAIVLGQFELVVGGYTFRGYVLNQASSSKGPYPISVDLEGDGRIQGGISKIIVRGGGVLDIGANSGSGAVGSIAASLSTPSRNFRSQGGGESLMFTVSKKNGQVSVGSIAYSRNGVVRTATSIPSFNLYQDGHSNHWYGATDYGVLMDYYKPSTAAEELTMDYPGLGPCKPQFQAPAPEPLVQSPVIQTSPKLSIKPAKETLPVKELSKPESSPSNPIEEKIVGCGGCLIGDVCVKNGERIGDSFCDPSSQILPQKKEKELCANDYQCRSNRCRSEVCMSPTQSELITQKSFLQRVWDWVASIF